MKNDKFKIGNVEDLNHLIWEEKNRKTILNTPIFDLVEVNRESSYGVSSNFYTLKSPDWVTIIPWYLNEHNIPCFVMVQQFRHGNARVIREFPAGMVDEGEKAITSAYRELEEETTLSAERMIFLGKVNPNPAIMTNEANFYLAKNVYKVAEKLQLDSTEQIEVISVPVSEAIEKIGLDPLYDNGVMLMAVSLFLKHTKENPSLL